jgi:hypothetical protein
MKPTRQRRPDKLAESFSRQIGNDGCSYNIRVSASVINRETKMPTKIGVSANTGTGPVMGNPALRPDGTIQGVSPPTATSTTASVTPREPPRPAQTAFDQRMPPVIRPREQAIAAGGDRENYGNVGLVATAEVPLPQVRGAALMNADPARNTAGRSQPTERFDLKR